MHLKELAEKHNADKKVHTSLLDQYEECLPKECKIFLEIGCLYGNSARMFREWYGDSTDFHLLDLFGEGYLDEETIKAEGFATYKGSQSDIELLNRLPKEIGVVTEDGSHHSDEQIITFKHLFKNNLASGGLYVIEDCYGHFDAYWRRGMVEKPEDTIVGVYNKFRNGEDFTGQFFTKEEVDYFYANVGKMILFDDINLFIWRK